MPERATEPAARVTFDRPATPLASEVKPRARLPASEPAAATVTATSAEAPAAIAAGATKPRRALPLPAVTTRLSWKAASARTRLPTAKLAAAPTRTLPKARAAACSGWARS